MAEKKYIPKLIVLSSQFRGEQFELKDDMYTLGRVEERDITIKDSSISSHHCDLIRQGDSYLIRDNNSTNGTRVNNIKVHEKLLQNSDILQLGGVEVLFDAKQAASSSSTAIGKTVTGITITDIAQNEILQQAAVQEQESKFNSQKIIIIALGGLAVLVVLLVLAMILLGH